VRFPTLMSGLAQESPGIGIENALMGGAAVGTDKIPSGHMTVFQSDLPQGVVVGGIGGPKDDADVHHDVDEERLRTDERGQIAAFLPAQGQSSACLNQ